MRETGGHGLLAGYRRILVVGAGRSGLGAAAVLAAMGREVLLSDSKDRADLPGVAGAEARGARFLDPPQDPAHLDGVDLVIKSPGVPGEAEVVRAARERGLPVWSELELAYRLFPQPFTAVTGTNGKTTTTALLGHMFRTAGRPARILGNIGVAVTSVAGTLAPDEELVVELSSFQLEDVHTFRPAAGILLNLTQDHLDRHGTMGRYLACKANLFAHQRTEDWAVLNLDDPAVAGLGREIATRRGGPRLLFFSTAGAPAAGSRLVEGRLYLLGRPALAVGDLALRGLHNVENCLAAGTAALARGLELEAVVEALRTFPGVPHRLQRAGVVAGVAYVNDSKATNVEATLKALGAYPAGTHLILGGRDKGSDYRPIARACVGACRGVYLIGEAAPLIREAFARVREDEGLAGVPVPRECGDLETAVEAASRAARAGETVLLAPACASFDQYRDFEERGDHFMAIVAKLGGGRG
ncbi:MAG: UDP-N-acetylmuramoyl-L-alanine--D-glutamate ligase [Actinobacteria bacterium]|nr:UDP-N-acetylmuramoyl-L-alanine--D-glutamate ligase [Actinomycetota bacterium]